MLLYLDRPHALVAKVETDRIPLVRTWMRLLDCVFIDRDNARKSMEAMNKAGELVKSGKSVVVFPEGTRSKGDQMGEFKAGAFRIASKVGADVVPVAIDGSYKIMEANGGLMKPAHVNVTILPPVSTAGLDRAQLKQLPCLLYTSPGGSCSPRAGWTKPARALCCSPTTGPLPMTFWPPAATCPKPTRWNWTLP